MLLGSLFTFLFSLIMMVAILAAHFGSHSAMFYVLKSILDGRISFVSFLRNEVFQMSTLSFGSFVMALILLVVSLGLFLAFIFPEFESHFVNALFVFGIFAFGVSYGGITVIRKDTGGMFSWKGNLAIISGWLIIIVSVIFAFIFFWKSFVEGG